MLIIYSQVQKPTEEDNKRFDRIKKAMAKTFKMMKKESDKIGKEKLIMKEDQNFLAIFQFKTKGLK